MRRTNLTTTKYLRAMGERPEGSGPKLAGNFGGKSECFTDKKGAQNSIERKDNTVNRLRRHVVAVAGVESTTPRIEPR
jgi:hypothetical protein